MASNSPYIVVPVYPNCRMRNGDNGMKFECEDPILFRTQRVETLFDLRSLILNKFGGTQAREIGRVAYRLLAPMGNGVFRFRLFRLLGDEHVRLMFDIHGRIMVEQDEDYMVDSGDSDLSDSGDEDECVLETPVQTLARHVLPPPLPIPVLSAVPSHYHSLDLDAMHERTPFLDTGEEDYNLDNGVEFRVGHKFKSREAVLQGVKNYNIRRSAEYRVIESNRLKYHM
ncbi:hypothetical protein Ahy_A07g032074 isoform D [Arachis hypogaea]|uniref:Transposase MuDR plant domain-containing protein n=1 Tax=Arachis hypogaea TaxID=3818 RepID=A0A445C5W1_ARAHY|nr:hypothetical protein Ahy_A07g032074 isoform D [Arachis hypogaea]